MGHELGNLLRFTKPPPSLTDGSRRQTLGLLNVIRCDSHRWAIETALAVLPGECEGLRSQKIKDALDQMGPIYGEGVL